jgi:hypothetical protein
MQQKPYHAVDLRLTKTWQILEREIEITKLKASNDMALLRSSWGDGEVSRKQLSQRPEAKGILSLTTPHEMQKWLRAFFARHKQDPRIAPHRDSVLSHTLPRPSSLCNTT